MPTDCLSRWARSFRRRRSRFPPHNIGVRTHVHYRACSTALINVSRVRTRRINLRKKVAFAVELDDADRAEAVYSWDLRRYPWLDVCYSSQAVPSGGRATRELPSIGLESADGGTGNLGGKSYNSTVATRADGASVVTLRFTEGAQNRAALRPGTRIFLKHMANEQSWGIHGRNVTGGLTIERSTLWSVAGMGFRADFCDGRYSLLDSEVVIKPGTFRPMSITADGTHWMHHSGPILLRNTSVQGQGDDGFNIHGNFILAVKQLGLKTIEYIDERGSGWIHAAPTMMLGDQVHFFSRRTLQPIGAVNEILAATETTVTFAAPLPAELKRFDMFHSRKRVASLSMSDCFFGNSNSRGVVLSAINATIERTTFANLSNDGIAIIEGGCGCEAADYTEGPFSRNVVIRNNMFDSVSTVNRRSKMPLAINNIAALQITGCVPIGECGVSGGVPLLRGADAPAATLAGGVLRISRFTVPGAINITRFKFYAGTFAPPTGVAMAIYSASYLKNGVPTSTNHPTRRLAVVASGGFSPEPGGGGWWAAGLPSGGLQLPNGTYYVAHIFPAGPTPWRSMKATGFTQSWPGQTGLPVDLVQNWSVWQLTEPVAIAVEWLAVGGWCDLGGTLPPPVTPDNAGDPVRGWDGGHLTEPGSDLQGGATFAKNITIEANVFVAPATGPYGRPWMNNFLNLGGVNSLMVRNNTLIRRAPPSVGAGADMVLYSNPGAVIQANRCFGSGAAENAVECLIRNSSSCNTSVSHC